MRSDQRVLTFFAAPLLVAAALMATGCTPQPARWSAAESPKANKVDFVTTMHEVHFAPGMATASNAQVKALSGFLKTAGLRYGDQVTIDAGPSTGHASRALAARRLRTVTGMLRKLHVRAHVAPRPTVDGALGRNGVIVTVGRYVVTSPACPDRSKVDNDDFANTDASNFGCATETNLGLMVANPADLVRGEPPGAADGTLMARGVEEYRKGTLMKTLPSGLSGGGVK